jgi:hypothetical protein
MQRMVNLCPDALLDDGLLDFTLLFGTLSKQVRGGIVWGSAESRTTSHRNQASHPVPGRSREVPGRASV